MRGNFFLHRVVGALSGMVVGTDRIMVLKRLLHRHMKVQGIEGYGSCTGRQDQLILVSCPAKTLWADGLIPVLYGSTLSI